MSEEEVINTLTNFLTLENNKWENRFNKGTLSEAIDTVLQLLEQKDTRIDELEKALVDEAIKSTEKIKELNNKINKVIDKMNADKMEQFDDYVIYLIESYLKILEE